jgi:hypothetical protein
MRQIFTSPRLDNVQTVQGLLSEAGIATRITDGRSWNRATKRDFSYTDRDRSEYKWPALWVTESEDYARARQLLRDQGVLIESTRPETGSFLPSAAPLPKQPARMSRANRIRFVMFGVAFIGAVIVAFKLFGNF